MATSFAVLSECFAGNFNLGAIDRDGNKTQCRDDRVQFCAQSWSLFAIDDQIGFEQVRGRNATTGTLQQVIHESLGLRLGAHYGDKSRGVNDHFGSPSSP